MNNKIFIHIFGLNLDDGRQKKRQIRQELEGLNLTIDITLIEGESRDLFSGVKETHAIVMYQEPVDQEVKRGLRTVTDCIIRHMDVILLPVSGILSQNRTGLF